MIPCGSAASCPWLHRIATPSPYMPTEPAGWIFRALLGVAHLAPSTGLLWGALFVLVGAAVLVLMLSLLFIDRGQHDQPS